MPPAYQGRQVWIWRTLTEPKDFWYTDGWGKLADGISEDPRMDLAVGDPIAIGQAEHMRSLARERAPSTVMAMVLSSRGIVAHPPIPITSTPAPPQVNLAEPPLTA